MYKHTPGPWHILPQGDANEYALMILDNKRWICSLRINGEFTTIEEKANAKLIAAAPELLEALELISDNLKDQLFDDDYTEINAIIEIAEKVISKAKGE